MNFRRWKTLFIVFLQGCACEFSSLDRISQIKTPYEKMIAEQEYERQKNEAKPLLIAETTPANIMPTTPTETTVVDKIVQIDYSSFPINGESDKSTAGDLQSIFFDFNWQTLNKNQKNILQQNAQELLRYPRVNIILSAHSDSLGNPIYNRNLSRNRALNVYKYLLKLGVPENRMSVKIAGNAEPLTEVEFKPIKNKSDLEYYKKALSQNRRVNFIVDSIQGINEVQRNYIAAQANQPREILVNEEPTRAVATTDQPDENFSGSYHTIYFPPSSARLSKEELIKLSENIKIFKEKKDATFIVTIYVKGLNPDKVKQNMPLSSERAKVIYQQLLEMGLKEDDFSIKLAKIDDSEKLQLAAKEFRKVAFNEVQSKKEPIYASTPENLDVPETPTLSKAVKNETPISSDEIILAAKAEPLSNNQVNEKLNLIFESKKKNLTKFDEEKLLKLVEQYSKETGTKFSFALNTKGKTPSILSINQKLTDSRIKYIKSLFGSLDTKRINFIVSKPDLEDTKANTNYRSLTVQIESVNKNLLESPKLQLADAKTKIEATNPVVNKVITKTLILNFESKKSNLESDSVEKLRELSKSLSNFDSKLSLELYIKGTKARDLAINAKLTDKRKNELIRLLQTNKISKDRLNFKLIKIDLEANRPKIINYRQITIKIETPQGFEVPMAKTERIETPKEQTIDLKINELNQVQEELENELSNDSIADVIATPDAQQAIEAKPVAEIDLNYEIEFVSKNKSLTPESIKKLEAVLKQLKNSDAKLTFTLFVKGSSPSKIRINQRLADSRKHTILNLLKTFKINSNRISFNLTYPDKEKSDKRFNGNYRLCLITPLKGEFNLAKEVSIERKTSSLSEKKKTFKKKKFKKLKKKKPLR